MTLNLNFKTTFKLICLFTILTLTFLSACNQSAALGLELTQPSDNLTVNKNSLLVSGTVNNATTLSYTLNGGIQQTIDSSTNSFAFTITLSEGSNTLVITAANASNQQSITRTILYQKPPEVELRIIEPANDITVSDEDLSVEGIARNSDTLTYQLNGASAVTLNSSRDSFNFTVKLQAGDNTITLRAENAGGSATLTRKIVLNDSKNAYAASLTANSPSFVRPTTGTGMSDRQRTVKYHLFKYTATSDSYHEITSDQTRFDGYLMLYESSFDPANPSQNLIAQNDDSASYDETVGGNSRIRTALELGKSYIIVTTACGSIDANCGAQLGNFSNRITENVPAPPPTFTLPAPDNSRYNITLRFADDDITKSVTEAQRSTFTDAIAFWENIITGDVVNFGTAKTIYPAEQVIQDTGPVVGIFDDVLIDIKFSNLDGPSGLLGQAAPRIIRLASEADSPLTVWGMMEFDIGEFAQGGFFANKQAYKEVVIHEMGHVLGIGTLWTDKNLVDENFSRNPPRVPAGLPNPNYDPGFTGAETAVEFNKLLKAIGEADTAKVVPIANSGGPGNFNGHWREIVFGDELMTPFAEGLERLSAMTVASLEDLGYEVDRTSSEIETGYKLPPQYVPAILRQTKPNRVSYIELTDFAAAKNSVKEELTATVETIDLQLTTPANSTSGCEKNDYTGFKANSIALVQRGGCTFANKIDLAVTNGASAILIMNQGDTSAASRQNVFGIGGLSGETAIPVMALSYDLGNRLAAVNGLELYLNTGLKANSSTLSTLALKGDFEIISGPIGGMLPDGTIIMTGERPAVLERVRKLYSEGNN